VCSINCATAINKASWEAKAAHDATELVLIGKSLPKDAIEKAFKSFAL
jgi:hypothetical protein